MRSRDLINGFDYGEYMQNQMFCFGSSDGGGSSGGGDPRGESSMSGGAGAFGEAGRGGRTGGSDGRESREAMERATAGQMAAQAAREAAAEAARPGISPGLSQAALGTPAYAGASSLAAAAAAAAASGSARDRAAAARLAANDPSVAGYMSDVAALQNLNRQLENLSRREAMAQSRLRSPVSLIPGFGLANYMGLQNVRNLAASAIGQPPGLLGGLGFGERVSPEFGGLSVSGLAGLQSQAVTDDMGNIVGFRDEYGTLKYGTDPNAPDTFGDGPETIPAAYNPVTGEQDQCPEGYVFDEDLQACRMGGDLPMDYTAQPGVGPATGDLYGRMGLLDIAPTGLGMFQQRYNAGFGMPSEFDVANRAFRQSGGVTRPYQGYTLLS